jgi:protein-S-isoprenylcysteine O-methyltransferase
LARASGLGTLLVFWLGLLARADTAYAHRDGWQWAGLPLMLAGIGLRVLAIRTLGPYFVSETVVRPGQPLVRRGIYQFVRHPSETGLLAMVAGASLLLESRAALVVCFLMLLPISVWRVRREDRCLDTAFGQSFRAYARHVRAWLPFLL